MPASVVKVAWNLYFGLSHGISYTSQEQLAQDTNIDKSDVGRALRSLVDVGLIERVDQQTLIAARQSDGKYQTDKRLVGYRRVIDPGLQLSEAMAALVSVKDKIPSGTKIHAKKAVSATATDVAAKLKNRSSHWGSDEQIEGVRSPRSTPETRGYASLNSERPSEQDQVKTPLDIEGNNPRNNRVYGPLLEEEQNLGEMGASSAHSPRAVLVSSSIPDREEKVGARKGAHLPQSGSALKRACTSALTLTAPTVRQTFDSEVGEQVYERITALFGVPEPRELIEICRNDPQVLGTLVDLYEWEVAKGDRDPVDLPTFLACLPSDRTNLLK